MKRYGVVFIALLFLLSVPVAAWVPTNTWKEGETTLIGVFVVKDTSFEPQYRDWMASRRNICLRLKPSDGDGYVFFDVPADGSMSFSVNSNGVTVKNTGGSMAIGFGLKYQDGAYRAGFVQSFSPATSITYQGLVSSTYFSGLPPVGSYNYWPEVPGQLGLRDDLDDTPPPDEDEGGILDWLGKFWARLLDFFVGLFVPDSAYFDDWFREIREAFEAKTGGLGDVLETIKRGLGSLGTDSMPTLEVGIADDALYAGSAGVRVNFLPYLTPVLRVVRPVVSALVVVLTAVACYRRLTDLIGK